MLRKVEQHPHLLTPESLGGHPAVRWLGNRMIGSWVGRSAKRVIAADLQAGITAVKDYPAIGVLIDARRPKHPHQLALRRGSPIMVAERVKRSLAGVSAQDYPAERVQPPLVIVDQGMNLTNEYWSTLPERTRPKEASRQVNDAETLNEWVKEVCHLRPDIVLVLKAGSHYATNQAFRAAVLARRRGSVAAFGLHLPDDDASVTQSAARVIRSLPYLRRSDARPAPLDRPGLIPADGMAYDAQYLSDHPFLPWYARGGGNHQFLRYAYHEGQSVTFEPALSVQSGEWNLGPWALALIANESLNMHEPTPWD